MNNDITFLIISDLHQYKDINNIFKKINTTNYQGIIVLGDLDIKYLKDIYSIFPTIPLYLILGNHDNYNYFKENPQYKNIHGCLVNINNYDILGIEGAFKSKKLRKIFDYIGYSDEEIISILRKYKHVDIILSHNSPYAIHHFNDTTCHKGFVGIKKLIKENQNKIIIHGHHHLNQHTIFNNNDILGVYGIVEVSIKNNKIIDKKIIYIP